MRTSSIPLFILLFCLAVPALSANDTPLSIIDGTSGLDVAVEAQGLLSWQRNFARSSLGAKTEIIRDASRSENVASFGPLFDQALSFAISNHELLGSDPVLVQLVAAAAEGISKTNHTASVPKLWRIFMSWRESVTRVPVLGALAVLGRGDGQLVENLNQYLATQNTVFLSGMAPDIPSLEACIDALGKLNSNTSFTVLFSTMVASYPDSVRDRASQALRSLGGDYRRNLVDVIRRNSPKEKLAAFREGTGNSQLNVDATGEIAEVSLEVALQAVEKGSGGDEYMEQLRLLAVRELKNQRWSRATPLLIRHFHLLLSPPDGSSVDTTQLVEAIQALGAMADSRAAQVLSLHLGLLNAEMERSKTWDDRILPATIDALGQLGDKMAFDYLLYTGYLPYPDDIKAMARSALNRLKW